MRRDEIASRALSCPFLRTQYAWSGLRDTPPVVGKILPFVRRPGLVLALDMTAQKPGAMRVAQTLERRLPDLADALARGLGLAADLVGRHRSGPSESEIHDEDFALPVGQCVQRASEVGAQCGCCLLYTSDAADERSSVD